jgi:hypothetical protein
VNPTLWFASEWCVCQLNVNPKISTKKGKILHNPGRDIDRPQGVPESLPDMPDPIIGAAYPINLGLNLESLMEPNYKSDDLFFTVRGRVR